MKTLEAHKDPHKECIKVLCPIVQTADYPVKLAAIKMQTRAIERTAREPPASVLSDIIPGLLQGYDNTESSVRKASVFCLVAVYSVIGEELKPYLAQLTGSKMKLLNLYIKRAQTSTATAAAPPTSPHTSSSSSPPPHPPSPRSCRAPPPELGPSSCLRLRLTSLNTCCNSSGFASVSVASRAPPSTCRRTPVRVLVPQKLLGVLNVCCSS
uniref:TOG domain-containing protein n=1 Tax=Gasterosteus aculeatus aculeatus TaxID=481459 RepID=A0AAQ4QWB0_GASAC